MQMWELVSMTFEQRQNNFIIEETLSNFHHFYYICTYIYNHNSFNVSIAEAVRLLLLICHWWCQFEIHNIAKFIIININLYFFCVSILYSILSPYLIGSRARTHAEILSEWERELSAHLFIYELILCMTSTTMWCVGIAKFKWIKLLFLTVSYVLLIHIYLYISPFYYCSFFVWYILLAIWCQLNLRY